MAFAWICARNIGVVVLEESVCAEEICIFVACSEIKDVVWVVTGGIIACTEASLESGGLR